MVIKFAKNDKKIWVHIFSVKAKNDVFRFQREVGVNML